MNKVVISILVGTVVILGGIVALSSSQSKSGSADSSTAGHSITGDQAPDFTLPSTDGRTIHLTDYRGKQDVLLYFHEGLTCQPCIDQVAELQKIKPQLDALNVPVFAIALDSVQDQQQALARINATQIPALSYENAQTEVDYDLTRFSMGMGRRAGHTFMLVSKDGVIDWRKDYWTGNGMSAPGGTMFVKSDEILTNVKSVLNAKGAA